LTREAADTLEMQSAQQLHILGCHHTAVTVLAGKQKFAAAKANEQFGA